MPVSLRDKVVLVMGASSGIGRAAACLFAAEGARVMAAARRENRLRALQDELKAAGHTIEIHGCDATQASEMDELGKVTHAKLGRVDVMVYVSGVNTLKRAMTKLDPPTWDHLISVNLNGAFYATQAVLPGMREAGSGHLIYVSSISGLVPDQSGAA